MAEELLFLKSHNLSEVITESRQRQACKIASRHHAMIGRYSRQLKREMVGIMILRTPPGAREAAR